MTSGLSPLAKDGENLSQCHSCGQPIGSEQFCAYCGAPQPSAPADEVQSAPQTTRVLAGFWKRVGAAVIDWLILAVPTVPLFVGPAIMSVARGTEVSFSMWPGIVSTLVSVLYFGFFEGNGGRTPGKMALKLRVLRAETGAAIDLGTGFLRALARVLFFVPAIAPSSFFGIWNIVDPLWMLFDSRNQTLHDKIAKTIVVDEGAQRETVTFQ